MNKHAPADREPCSLTNAARASLLAHDWPGNVRELENVLIRGTHLCRNGQIEIDDLGLPMAPPQAFDLSGGFETFTAAKRRVLLLFEREYLLGLMTQHGGNVSHAASAARKDRRNLRKLLKKHCLDPRSFRPG